MAVEMKVAADRRRERPNATHSTSARCTLRYRVETNKANGAEAIAVRPKEAETGPTPHATEFQRADHGHDEDSPEWGQP